HYLKFQPKGFKVAVLFRTNIHTCPACGMNGHAKTSCWKHGTSPSDFDVTLEWMKARTPMLFEKRNPRKNKPTQSSAASAQNSSNPSGVPSAQKKKPFAQSSQQSQSVKRNSRSEERRVGKECRYRWSA